jgi:CRP/FNR family cyclic AMP-dependent transcriptional regulator
VSDHYAELMTTFPLFKGYTPHGAKMLMSRGQLREIAPGELLFAEGEPASSVLLMLTGKAEIFVNRDGREVRLSHVEPSRMLGELSVLGGVNRPASARAVEPTAVLEWSDRDFRRLIATDVGLSQRIFRELIQTLAEEEEALVASLAAVKATPES